MPGINLKQQQDDSAAKAYAFVLMLFDKCVFVSANSLVRRKQLHRVCNLLTKSILSNNTIFCN